LKNINYKHFLSRKHSFKTLLLDCHLGVAVALRITKPLPTEQNTHNCNFFNIFKKREQERTREREKERKREREREKEREREREREIET